MEPSSRASRSKWHRHFCLCFLISFGALARAARAQDLPEGKGKDLVEQVCIGCHGLEVIAGQRATSKGWSGIVDNMIQRGATATPEEIHTIVEYLAKHFAKAEIVNVNKASVKEMETALELTSKEAAAIVKYRREHGEFKDWGGLGKVGGIEAKKLEAKRDRIAFQ
jgi:competence ComEA-like helix-hairpin-helix protein